MEYLEQKMLTEWGIGEKIITGQSCRCHVSPLENHFWPVSSEMEQIEIFVKKVISEVKEKVMKS